MTYELAHLIKNHLSILWNVAEWANAVAFSLKYRKGMKRLNEIVNTGVSAPYEMRRADQGDEEALANFFAKQPEDAFRFFRPHCFKTSAIRSLLKRKSFLAFLLVEHQSAGDEILGYAFMRCFVNGAAYRGYMTDAEHRGMGIARLMGIGLNKAGDSLGLTMYKSISLQNTASMSATQKVCDTIFLKTLDNGDILMKCISKHTDNMEIKNNLGGVKVPVSLH